MLTLQQLEAACDQAAAIRRRRRLQPAGGPGDKIFPPTYPGNGQNALPRHVFELRRIEGCNVPCVLIDSVQSQANRLEEALLAAAKAGRIALPRIVVDFPSTGLNAVPAISSLEAPHRVFDAILRDSALDGVPFRQSPRGIRLRLAKPQDATAILEMDPTALLFGAWNSTSEGGGLGAKFTRAIVSEIVGIRVAVEQRFNIGRISRSGNADTIGDVAVGERELQNAGRRTSSRIDPLGIRSSVEIYKSGIKGSSAWDIQDKEIKKPESVSAAKVNHGNIKPSVDSLGVTCDYAEQVAVITLAGLRRLAFGNDPARNRTGRAYIAALGLLALTEADAQGYALRSRCDLVAEGESPLQLVHSDGRAETIELSRDEAVALYAAAFKAAREAGFSLDGEPIMLKPQDKLVHIVRESQKKALQDEGGADEAG